MTVREGLYFSIAGLLFAALFIPLVVTKGLYFPFITGKVFTFRILVELALLLWLILAFFDETVRPRKSWLLYFYSALIIVLSLATIVSADPFKSFWSNFERMEGLLTHLHLFAYFLVLGATFRSERMWQWFFHTSLGVAVFVVAYSILQLFGLVKIFQSTERLEATFGNATYLAVYMLFHIFLAAFLWARNRERLSVWMQSLYGVLILLFTLVLFLTETRGAVIGFLAGVIVFAILQAALGSGRMRKAALAGLFAVVVLVGGFIAVRDTEFVKETRVLRRLSTVTLEDDSVQARFTIWGMALEGFKERPLLGWGPENFNIVFNKYYEPELYSEEQWFDRAHNVFLDWLITAGIFGLLFYLSLFAAAGAYLSTEPSRFHDSRRRGFMHLVKRVWEHLRAPSDTFMERSILIALLAGYFVQNVFVFDNITSYVIFFSVLAYVHQTYGVPFAFGKRGIELGRNTKIVVVLVLSVLLLTFSYWINVKPIQAARGTIVALTPSNREEGVLYNLNTFQEVIALDTFGTAEAREQLMRLASGVGANPNMPDFAKTAFFETARAELEKQVEERPRDARYQQFLGSFLNQFGRHEEALVYLEMARKNSPQKQPVLFDTANSYLGLEEYDKAFRVLEEAYTLAPENNQAAIFYAVGAIYVKDFSKADEILENQFGRTDYPHEQLVAAYIAVDERGRAIEILESIKKDRPELRESADEVIRMLRGQ